jgi:hypothetical protein
MSGEAYSQRGITRFEKNDFAGVRHHRSLEGIKQQ